MEDTSEKSAKKGLKEEEVDDNEETKDPKNKAILKAMKDMDAGNGKNILSASIETFSMADGKNKKGDAIVRNSEDALTLLKGMVEKAAESEAAKAQKKKKKKGDAGFKNKWDFETCPLEEFGKTLDDVFVAFLYWALVSKDASKDDDDDEDAEKVFNVTKAFRRLEAYADWMADTGTDLTEPKLTTASMKEVNDVWKMKLGYSKSDCLTWWIDFTHLDTKAIKATPDVDSMRLVVWYSHFIMFDERAQKNGIIMVENMAKMGFFTMMTLIPPKLSAKMDKLTIGVLPVKMKKIYLMECSTWVNIIMAIMKPFMSKKMRSRIVNVDKEKDDKMTNELGGPEYVVEGFGSFKGTLTDDPLAGKFV